MLHQTYDLADWPRLLTLTFVELALSADNAIVLGILSRSLSEPLRKRALTIGVFSAFFLRGASLFGLSILLRYFWIQLVGGVYLVFLSIHHFLSSKKRKAPGFVPSASFWKIFFLIEAFDLIFAIDSMLAGLALIASPGEELKYNPKLWIVYAGGIIGVIGVRYAARWFSTLIDQFPRLETSAFLLIGWIGLKLSFLGIEPLFDLSISIDIPFWIGMALFLLWGFLYRKPQNKL